MEALQLILFPLLSLAQLTAKVGKKTGTPCERKLDGELENWGLDCCKLPKPLGSISPWQAIQSSARMLPANFFKKCLDLSYKCIHPFGYKKTITSIFNSQPLELYKI